MCNSMKQCYYGGGYPRRGDTPLQKALCAVSECFRIHGKGNEVAEACNAAYDAAFAAIDELPVEMEFIASAMRKYIDDKLIL